MKQGSKPATREPRKNPSAKPAGQKKEYILSRTAVWIAVALLAGMTAIVTMLYLLPMETYTASFGFPFDQSYIPLTYARNLITHGAYSFFSDVMTASGSTSPLYVFLLAIAALFTGSGFVPSVVIGIASTLAAVILLFFTARKIFEADQWIAIAVSVAFLLFPRVQSAMLSGMSTMLYTALIVGALYMYYNRKTVLFFLLTGLALWVRPDALIFLIAAFIHIGYTHGMAKRTAPSMDADTARRSKADLRKGLGIIAVLIAVYVLFNQVLSGSIFPTSVGAKMRYYGLTESHFWYELGRFLTVGPSAVLFAFAIIGVVLALRKMIRRESTPVVFPVAYIVGTILAYWLIHPYLYESQRYLIPVIPFFLLLSAWSIREIFIVLLGSIPVDRLRSVGRGVLFIVFAGAMLVGLFGFSEMRDAHYAAVRYNNERGVKAAKWLEHRTSSNALIGTHTPGVIGWFADREVMDFSGVVSPELIPTIGNLTDLTAALVARKADYLLTNRDQFEVVNINPVFQTDIRQPGITEVFRFIPVRVVIVAQTASRLNATAESILAQRRPRQALDLLQQSFRIEPRSCRTNLLAAYAFLDEKDTASAVSFIKEAVTLHPDYALALELMGNVYMNQDSVSQAYLAMSAAKAADPESESISRGLDKAIYYRDMDSLRKLGWAVTRQPLKR